MSLCFGDQLEINSLLVTVNGDNSVVFDAIDRSMKHAVSSSASSATPVPLNRRQGLSSQAFHRWENMHMTNGAIIILISLPCIAESACDSRPLKA